MNHVITVNDRQIDIDKRFVIANGMNVDTFEVVVDGEWKDFDIVVAFEDEKGNSIKMDYDGGVVAIPSKAIENEGTLSVSVIGYNGDGKYRLTTAKAASYFVVVESGVVDGDDPFPEEPDLLSRILSVQKQAEEAAKRANEAADRIEDFEYDVTSYDALNDKPTLNEVEIAGDKGFDDYGLDKIDYDLLDSMLSVLEK